MTAKLPDLDARLRDDGYRPGVPSAEVAAADAGTCARIACAECRRPGLDYRPYVHPALRGRGPDWYRALAVCEACGRAEEF